MTRAGIVAYYRKHRRTAALLLMVLGVEQIRNLLLNHDQRLERLEGDGRVPVDDVVTLADLERALESHTHPDGP